MQIGTGLGTRSGRLDAQFETAASDLRAGIEGLRTDFRVGPDSVNGDFTWHAGGQATDRDGNTRTTSHG